MRSNKIKIMASAFVIALAAVYLFQDALQADPDALTYFYPADVVIMEQPNFLGKKIRMGGHVKEGTILQKKGTLDYRFEVKPVEGMAKKYPEALDKTMVVTFSGIVPDTFKDNNEVVVTGVLGPDGTFVAKDLLAKCPSKYEAAEKNAGTY